MYPEYYYLWQIGLATLLSLVIGVEREYNQKHAGIRTHTLVGLGAALFMVVSKYGFFDLAAYDGFSLDGSRIAAQVASGIGFIGAGLIFIRRDLVRGLTTAASIWLVAAVGLAAGAGMPIISSSVVVIYLVVMLGIKPLARYMPHSRATDQVVRVRYVDGQGILRDVLTAVSQLGVSVDSLESTATIEGTNGKRSQEVTLVLRGAPRIWGDLLVHLQSLPGVEAVDSGASEA